MQTFDQGSSTTSAGRVDLEEETLKASSPHDFKLLVASDGRRGTTMEDVAHAEAQRAA